MTLLMNYKNILLCCIWFVMLSMTFFSDFIPTPHGAYADQRFILCLSLILLVALGMHSIKLRSSKVIILIPLIGSFIIGGLMSFNNPFNWVEPVLYCLFFVAIVLIGHYIFVHNMQVDLSRVFIVLSVIVCFFYASLTLMLYVFSLEQNLATFADVMPAGFVNIRYWSHTATWLLPLFPLAILYYHGSKYRIWHCMVMFTAAIWWWLAIHMMSRGSIFSLSIATLIILIMFKSLALPWLKLMLVYLALGILTWFLLSYVVPEWILNLETTLLREVNTSTSGRLPLWEEAWAMSLQNFPFGMGAQSWLTHELISESYKASHKFGHPHNMYLMWAAEYGWLCIMSLLGLVIWALWKLKRQAASFSKTSTPKSEVLIAFSVAVFAGFIHASVSAVLIVPASMMLALGVLTVFWSLILPDLDNTHKIDLTSTSKVKPLFFVLVFGLFAMIWLLNVWNYHQAMVADLATEEGARAQYMMPRFWVYGNYPRPDSLIEK